MAVISGIVALTVAPATAEILTEQQMRTPHRASVDGEKYLIEVSDEVVLIDPSTLKYTNPFPEILRRPAVVNLSRDGSAPFRDTPDDRQAALTVAVSYCRHHGILVADQKPYAEFREASAEDNATIAVFAACEFTPVPRPRN